MKTALLAAYLRQQSDCAMPDFPMGPSFDLKALLKSITPRPLQSATVPAAAPGTGVPVRTPAARRVVPPAPAPSGDPYSRLSRLKQPVASGGVSEPVAAMRDAVTPISSLPRLTFDEKRSIFKELYAARCSKCPLSASRNSFVFGAGNVDARLMLIGEAPGADEDRLGMPFVGAAGKLLTELLEACSLDRKKDVFIANVLKCRPPANRTPGDAEIVACLPLLRRQIEVIAPSVLLLLGRTAAHAVLGTASAIGTLRGKQLDYRGIAAFVTYHPAALLRTPGYRAGTEEDLQRVVGLLKGSRDHAAV